MIKKLQNPRPTCSNFRLIFLFGWITFTLRTLISENQKKEEKDKMIGKVSKH